ncbi:cysteine-rich CWC family protein [Rhodoferax sp. U2-2l]|uniref:cysteine-rich CWC family protein n=1 Tax=Rhodoferax sp. U2-2l TaxID=2884000 RepID=UPI001D09C191|nr:cysteine-rich CWC family protein [Rhodoferax sp. U2-2l]MCB8746131.1 cysteine-rich CWC family protein [Rhodoferax sp. U2-2l]
MDRPTAMPHQAPPPAPQPGLCPICGQPNACAMEAERVTGVKQPPCWCTTASFSPSLLDRIPAAARHTACVCAACVAANPA